MKNILMLLTLIIAEIAAQGQQPAVATAEQEIIALERSFAEAIKNRDSVQAKTMQLETYFLAVAVQGKPLVTVPRSRWLATLRNYIVESYSIDDIKVNVYGNTAVALLLFTQKATAGGKDRSAQFLLTDIWVRQGQTWLIAERHSSRPEVVKEP